jgi:hypothetical protein
LHDNTDTILQRARRVFPKYPKSLQPSDCYSYSSFVFQSFKNLISSSYLLIYKFFQDGILQICQVRFPQFIRVQFGCTFFQKFNGFAPRILTFLSLLYSCASLVLER